MCNENCYHYIRNDAGDYIENPEWIRVYYPKVYRRKYASSKQDVKYVPPKCKRGPKPLPKRELLYPEWTEARKQVIERDTSCKICGISDNPHVHHIDRDLSNNDLSNLVRLCKNCHFSIHAGKVTL